MTFLTKISLVIGLSLATAAQAQDRPYQLVCFEQDGMTASLNKVVNAQQFLRNDSILQSGSCAFAQLPAGSTARFIDIHSSPQGFLYPIYRVTYATTGQRMYAADGVFRADQWKVRRIKGSAVQLITPVSCGVLDGYVQATNRVPKYMFVPEFCDVEVVQ
jgi:hypothetical protein